jgi:hypothetical protein
MWEMEIISYSNVLHEDLLMTGIYGNKVWEIDLERARYLLSTDEMLYRRNAEQNPGLNWCQMDIFDILTAILKRKDKID